MYVNRQRRASTKQSIVFTDLDGTLIDFETYSPGVAGTLAQSLSQRGVPVVFCSSKTLEEQLALMQTIGLVTPGIVENGSGIFLPDSFNGFSDFNSTRVPGFGRLVSLGVSSIRIRKEVAKLSTQMGIDFQPYSQLSPLQMEKATGLDADAALRARNRDFSETLTASLDDATWAEVNRRLAKTGLQCLCGGRFYTVSAANRDKGKALAQFVKTFNEDTGADCRSIGIGDSANDLELLKSVDLPYLVQRPDATWHPMELPGLNRVPAIGPLGWVDAIHDAFDM